MEMETWYCTGGAGRWAGWLWVWLGGVSECVPGPLASGAPLREPTLWTSEGQPGWRSTRSPMLSDGSLRVCRMGRWAEEPAIGRAVGSELPECLCSLPLPPASLCWPHAGRGSELGRWVWPEPDTVAEGGVSP